MMSRTMVNCVKRRRGGSVRLLHVGQHLVQHLELAALAQHGVAQAEVLNGLQESTWVHECYEGEQSGYNSFLHFILVHQIQTESEYATEQTGGDGGGIFERRGVKHIFYAPR